MMNMTLEAPTWLEVDLAAIGRNVGAVRKLVGPQTAVFVVLKANAYGHGLVEVGRAVERAGAHGIGVALLDEGVRLRDAGITLPILVMTSIPASGAEEAVRYNLICALCEPFLARALSQAAVRMGRPARVEIKVDTGMGRLGVQPQELGPFLEENAILPGLKIEGVFSHLSSADEPDLAFSLEQIASFQRARQSICSRGKGIRRWHLGSSAAAVRLPECRMDAVRVGLLAYGLNPAAPFQSLSLEPALTWKARIGFIKQSPAGAPISYGRSYMTDRTTRVATLGVGYADGYPRALSNVAEVLVDGQRAPVIGRICMDQAMIALPDGASAEVGDSVVLLGRQGQEQITTEELAERAGTILHELLARLGTRMPRVYQE